LAELEPFLEGEDSVFVRASYSRERYRGTSLIRNRTPSRTPLGP